MNTLLEKYTQYKQDNPKTRIRDVAKALSVSEAELVALGKHNMALAPRFQDILNDIHTLGYVMALTRNDDAVHERKGVYSESSFHGKVGFIANPDIDLRLFLFSWKYVFAVQEGERKSIQFFAKDGNAIHKIYLTEKSDLNAFQALISKYKNDAQPDALEIEASEVSTTKKADNEEVDIAAFQQDWLALEDTHHFFAILKKHDVSRTQALKIAPEGHSRKLTKEALKDVLYEAAKRGLEIMVFIGNKGCIQIHTGKITNLLQTGPWFNVLDEAFSMHLREDAIAEVWLVKKPTADGIVTSLEVFDAKGELIVQFFGKRKPGIPESEAWRELLNILEN